MKLRPFLLDQWIAGHAGAALPYNLGGSTGPSWTIEELLDLEPGSTDRLLRAPIAYQPSSGKLALREALAEMSGAAADDIVVTAGGAEALFLVFVVAAVPGGNVIVPSPGFPTYHAVPEALGLELRTYSMLDESGGFEPVRIKDLIDTNTRLIVVNTPHNPTGATVSVDAMRALQELAVTRGVQLVVDEVFHPIYHGQPCASASALAHTTVIGDLSKAFALPGLRIGWIVEPDSARRVQYVNAREYLSVSNNVAGEFLAEIAVRNHRTIHQRTQAASARFAHRAEVRRAGLDASGRWNHCVRPRQRLRGYEAVVHWRCSERPADGSRRLFRFSGSDPVGSRCGPRGVRACYESPVGSAVALSLTHQSCLTGRHSVAARSALDRGCGYRCRNPPRP
jgi:DNA-binding transcriptional MocR family regulator